jgi:hypothetical protein
MAYIVYVDDNFHFMDESERYKLGEFATFEEAVRISKKIVDEFLLSGYKPGMTARQLYEGYMMFGEDPFIGGPAEKPYHFSAWEYAKRRCEELCNPGENQVHEDEP